MQYDLSVILIPSSLSLSGQVHRIIHELNEEKISHEILIVCAESDVEHWKETQALSVEYRAVQGLLTVFNNGVNGQFLCGAQHASGKYIVTLDPRYDFPSRSIITLWYAISKSNCQLIYGRTEDAKVSSILKFLNKLKRYVFAGLSGLSPEISAFRIFSGEACAHLKAKTPFYFLFDHLISAGITHHSYLYFKTKKTHKRPIEAGYKSKFMRRVIGPIAWTSIAEISLVSLLVLNMIILLKGRLIFSLFVGISSILLVWIIYLVKWRRRIAYRVVERTALNSSVSDRG